MSNRFLSVKEEGVGRPDVAGQQVVQRQHLHGPFEAQTLVFPALTKEHVYGVFLRPTVTERQVLVGFWEHKITVFNTEVLNE